MKKKKSSKGAGIFYTENKRMRNLRSASHIQGMMQSCAQQTHFHLKGMDGDF